MSCPNATAPIDIVKNFADVCDKKCDMAFDYPRTSVTASNKDDYIRFSFDKAPSPPVFFNKEKYDVQEMRLYRPSLHTFSGSRAAAELVIVHNNLVSAESLLVCVPIDTAVSSGNEIDALIKQVSLKANSTGTTTNISTSAFTLNNIVPSKPYYFYNGTLPYSPCNGSYNIIVFSKDYSIKANSSSIDTLKKIISVSAYDTKTAKNGYFYNKDGPSTMSSGDDIYIECKPTGSEGSELIKEPKSSLHFDFDFDKYSWIIGAIVGAIILYILVMVFNIAFSKIFHKTINGDSGS